MSEAQRIRENYARLQAARAQQFADRDRTNQSVWGGLQNLLNYRSPEMQQYQDRRLVDRQVASLGSQIPTSPQMADASSLGLSTDVPLPSEPVKGEDIENFVMQGGIPPAIEMGPVSQQFAQTQQAARTGDDLNAFPSERSLPKTAQSKVQNEYKKSISDYMKQREKLIQNMQDRAKIIRESKQGMDLSPLLALIDSETGSRFSQAYQKPLDARQKEALAQRLEQGASTGLGALANLKQQQANQDLLVDKWERDNALREKLAGMRGQKPMSGEQLKRLDYVIGAEDSLDRLEKAVNDKSIMMRPDLPLVGDNDFTAALRDAAENYGRMQSGGAINKDEEKRFLAKVYKMGDSRERVLKKIKDFRKEMKGRRSRLLSGGREGVETPKQESNDEFLKGLGL